MTKSARLLLAALLLTATLQLQAGAPLGINYQSVARNASGQIVTNQRISLRLTIHDSIPTGTAIYIENHIVVTNAFGTFSVVIGGGSLVLGNFNNLAWGTNDKHLQVEMDFSGGTNYTNMGTSQLISVPYALYTNNSAGDISSIKYDTTGVLSAQTASGTVIPANKSVWIAGGNSGLSTTNNYIGTTDNSDFILKRGGKEGLRLTSGGALLATGDPATGVTPASGAGKRMEWIPAKGAFRAGSVTGTQWDDANIGAGSSAIGNDVMASGANAVAIGNSSAATGSNALAMGTGVIAKSPSSTVLGTYNDTTATPGNISDVLFQVGSGTATTRSNALTITKNGQVQMASLVMQDSAIGTPLLPLLSGGVTINPQNKAFIQIYTGLLPSSNIITLQSGTTPGQVVTIECVGSSLLGPLLQSTYGIQLKDVRTYPSTNNHFILNSAGSNNSRFDMYHLDMVSFIWDGTYWVETHRSVNH